MKKHLLLLFGLLFCLLLPVLAQDQDFPPKPNRLVSDFANMLEPPEEQALEQKLRNYNDTTSTQIAVVTMKSIGGYDVADYAIRLANKWGIGGKANNNGILILVALQERAMFITTGYGMEATVPDALAKRIVERTLKPRFRNEQYYQGLDEATSLIISLASGQYQAPEQAQEEGQGSGSVIWIILIVLVILFLARRGRGGRGGRGGGRTLMSPFPFGGIGPFGTFSSGRGPFSGGGGFGGGGGGFGGFGGGSFGGGGAGGRW
jgi:uncharacterized protein